MASIGKLTDNQEMLKIFLIFTVLINCTVSVPADIPSLFSGLLNGLSKNCLTETYSFLTELREIETLQNSKFNNVDVLYDKDLMKSLFGDLKSISLSIKSSNCSSMIFAKYLLDGTVFIGDNIYGEAFNCLSKENLESLFMSCAREIILNNQSIDILEHLKPVSRCVAGKLACSKIDKNSFIGAVFAGVDLFDTFSNSRSILSQIKENKMKLEFNKEKYYSYLN